MPKKSTSLDKAPANKINLIEGFSPFNVNNCELYIKNLSDLDSDGFKDFIIKDKEDVNYLIFGNAENDFGNLDLYSLSELKGLKINSSREAGYRLPKAKYLNIIFKKNIRNEEPETCLPEYPSFCERSKLVETRTTVDVHFDIRYDIKHSYTFDHGIVECVGEECLNLHNQKSSV